VTRKVDPTSCLAVSLLMLDTAPMTCSEDLI